jgi:hypothetical protein
MMDGWMWLLLSAIALIIALMVNLWQAIAHPFIVINFIDSPDRGLPTQSDRSIGDRRLFTQFILS